MTDEIYGGAPAWDHGPGSGAPDPFRAAPAGAARPGTGRTVGGVAALVIGIFLLFFAVVWLGITVGFGLLSGAGSALFDDSLVEADGRVVDLVRSTSSDGGASCRPVIAYPGREGEVLTFTGLMSESPCRRVGDVVRIHVDPEDPTRVYLDPFDGPTGLLLPIFAVIGGVLLVGGIGLVVGGSVALRRGRRAARAGDVPHGAWPPPTGAPASVPPPPGYVEHAGPGNVTAAGTYAVADEAPARPEAARHEAASPDAARPEGSGPQVAPPLF